MRGKALSLLATLCDEWDEMEPTLRRGRGSLAPGQSVRYWVPFNAGAESWLLTLRFGKRPPIMLPLISIEVLSLHNDEAAQLESLDPDL